MPTLVYAVGRPDVPPLTVSDRFRYEVAYFMSVPGEQGVPMLGQGEYWVQQANARQWLEDGVIHVVSPLDSENQTEVELSDEHESWLEWMIANQLEHIRLV